MKRAHVVGAGLAGLSAAMTLAEAGFSVTLSEASPQAGGRCRSYHDPKLGLTIDNGNHLLLSGNARAQAYLKRIGAQDRLTGPDDAAFDFVDLRSAMRWTIRPNDGPLPWWIALPSRRVPGTRIADYLPLGRLAAAPGDGTLADRLKTHGPLWEKLLEPFFVAALNTPAAQGSARLAAAIVAGTLAKGGKACRPLIAHPTLSAAFVDPALAWLERKGAVLRLGRRLRAIEIEQGRIARLAFADGTEDVAPDEPVILAVPSWVAAELVAGITVPDQHHAIVNAHFLHPAPARTPLITGVIGGTAEWIFAFPDRLSATVSAADALCEEDREAVARRIWADIAAIHHLSPELPPWQIVRERRATFAATPEQDRRRPPARTAFANLFLAGDWTQTGLPATIEGSILSGETAATYAITASRHHLPT